MLQQSDSMIHHFLRNWGFCIALLTLVVAFPWLSIQGQTYLSGKPCLNKGPNAVVQCKGWVTCTNPSAFFPSATIYGQAVAKMFCPGYIVWNHANVLVDSFPVANLRTQAFSTFLSDTGSIMEYQYGTHPCPSPLGTRTRDKLMACPTNPGSVDDLTESTLFSPSPPTRSACQLAGMFWSDAYQACFEQQADQLGCDSIGGFWGFASGICNEIPQSEPDCQFYGMYWNFTNGACGNSPAIGNCGAGPDWTNYFSTGCYTGLGLFSGSFCDRSETFKNKCYQYGGDYNSPYCVCTGCDVCGGSPILVDVNGDGFAMTDVAHGVGFDLNGNGTRDPLSWTAPGTDDAWLALDRNGNGVIDNGQELFGDLTPQPASPGKNGFRALAEFDKWQNGGNSDGVIDKNDTVYQQLRLWQDRNHNGISESSELQPLQNFSLITIELEYKMSKQTDSYGNEFKYRAKVKDTNKTKIARWAWDVFLQSVGL